MHNFYGDKVKKDTLSMRIAILSWESLHSVAVGGVAVHVSELAAVLAKEGHQVHVFTRRAPGQLGHDYIDAVHYHRCTYPAHHDFVDDINNMCRSFVDRVFEIEDFVGHFDIIHAHDWLAANAMIWIKQGRGHKCLLTVHSTEYARCGNAFSNGRSIRVREQERAGLYWADKVIAVSEAMKKEIVWMYEVPEQKTFVINNGVNPKPFDLTTDPGEDKRRYNISPLDPTVLFCGRLAWQKGPDLLIEAIPSALRFYSNAKFIFAGAGDMRGRLQSRTRQLGVEHAVRFLGYRNGDELIHLFKLADLVCVPSRNEPFGIVVLEAWSASKPVIVTQNGGPNEFVQHEVNGLKIHPHPDSIAWGVCSIFSDFERARRMGCNGRKIVEERFVWDSIVKQTLSVYKGVCLDSLNLKQKRISDTSTTVIETSLRSAYRAKSGQKQSKALSKRQQKNQPIKVQAKLSFGAICAIEEASEILDACKLSLTQSGLSPQQRGNNIIVRGDWEIMLAALHRCHQQTFGKAVLVDIS